MGKKGALMAMGSPVVGDHHELVERCDEFVRDDLFSAL